ncbi:hypothetical protein NE237_015210 [Protea cynaroides]|uniref:Uncharacterized protein n=1 Tax=Protea cynaroides TaxID=273540 RepID=A0A9Q0KDM0_9MAGN|nr:hypothetical protein NE237_015210 [Protea cynaroides]
MKLDPKRERSKNYYYYHDENGHDTDKCHALRYAIKDFIKSGHIREYVEKPTTADNKQKGKQPAEWEDNVEPRRARRNQNDSDGDNSASPPLNKIGNLRSRISVILKSTQLTPKFKQRIRNQHQRVSRQATQVAESRTTGNQSRKLTMASRNV